MADRTGLTKPGLMYHFPTKQALMDGLVDHVARSAEQQLSQRLDIPIEQASARQRLRAYVQWAVEGPHQRSDLVMFGDPRLVDQMTRRWTEHFSRWVQVPTDMPRPNAHGSTPHAWSPTAPGSRRPVPRSR